MKSAGFNNLFNFMFLWGRRFGAADVGARPQNFGRACRRPQNGSSGALPTTILGPLVEMLLATLFATHLLASSQRHEGKIREPRGQGRVVTH
jgi:hypothetical protein